MTRSRRFLIQVRGGEAVLHIRQDHPQCYKWSSLYALVNDGEGGFIVVVHPKDAAGFEPLQEDADIDTVLRLSIWRKLTPTSNTITAQTTVRVKQARSEYPHHW